MGELEELRVRVQELEDQLRRAHMSPGLRAREDGHHELCTRVVYPQSLYKCNCGKVLY